jgi:hypothetical protein
MNANDADANDADAADNNANADDTNDADTNDSDAAKDANTIANANANANKDNDLSDKVDPFPVLSYEERSRFIENQRIVIRFHLFHRDATTDGIQEPRFSIANGFVIGSFPQEIKFFNKEGQRVTRKVEDDVLTDTLKAMVAPLRLYGCVFAYSGGHQKSLRGNHQFFESNQNRSGE